MGIGAQIVGFIQAACSAEELRKENVILREENDRLRAENEALRQENAQLKEALEKLKRRSKRQASPFSRDKRKPNPKKPGRKKGKDYGERASRPIPDHIDRVVDAPVQTGVEDVNGAPACPECHTTLEKLETHIQYQTDIPEIPTPEVTQFNVETAECPCCHRRFQGRHPDQTSDALGAASNQLGPRVLAFAAQLKYEYGLSFGKVKRLLFDLFGLTIGRSTLARSAQRLADKAEPTYCHLIFQLRESGVVCADETGWRINGEPCWLWVFTDKTITVYVIDLSRGHEVIESVLGEDFQGTLSSDGFLAYDPVSAGAKQQCNAHLLKGCSEIEAIKSRGAVRFSRQVASVLRAGINLHRRRDKLSPHGFKVQRGKIEAALDRLLEKNLTDPDNARLARRLKKHRNHIFTYLYDETGETDPTNNLAELEIRPAVITRRNGACNRSPKGARATAILTSVMRSSKKNERDVIEVLVRILCSPGRIVVELARPP